VKLGLSDVISVTDLVENAAERVFGVGLNDDGSFGVARGEQSAYYFNRSLRLQGEFRNGMAGGAGGATLHPQHAGVTVTPDDQALSFLATGNRTIKIVDTRHFFQRGEIAIRDNVVGPVRAVMPSSAENVGRSPTDPNYIVVKLVAVTAGDHVLVVDVRRKDVGF
jgi:hypothetical protein